MGGKQESTELTWEERHPKDYMKGPSDEDLEWLENQIKKHGGGMMKRVYIAGALNAMAVSYIKNVNKMMIHAELVRQRGYAVFVPCLDVMMGICFGHYRYEDYFNNSQAWLEVCDVVYVCPDSKKSKGVKKEIALAKELNIPVIYNLHNLP